MENRPITVEEALGLSRQFLDTAVAIGTWLFDDKVWPTLPEAERARLRSLQVTLFNLATDMVTEAGGVVLKNAAKTIAELHGATSQARDALGTITQIGHAITIAGTLIGLAAAIPTGNMAAILGAAHGVAEAAGDAREARDAPAAGAGPAKAEHDKRV